MHSATSDALQDDGFLFQLICLMAMMSAFSIGLMRWQVGQSLPAWSWRYATEAGQSDRETGEAIDDLRNIAQLGYDEEKIRKSLKCRLKRSSNTFVLRAVMPRHLYSSATDRARSTKPTLH